MKLTTIALGVIAGSALAYNAYSLTCAQQPTCDSLGYTLTSTSDCIGTVLKCPFNTARYYCTTKTEALNKLQQDIVTAAMPDYSKMVSRSNGTTYTAATNGVIFGHDSMRGDAGARCDADIQIIIDNKNVRVGTSQINWGTNSWSYPVKKGSRYQTKAYGGGCEGLWFAYYFVPTI